MTECSAHYLSLVFRTLTDQEEAEYRAYARDNDPPNLENWNVYHPVCQGEWLRRGIHPPIDSYRYR